MVLYNDLGVTGDLSSPAVIGEPVLVRTIKTQLAGFNARYQMYGRTTRMHALASTGGAASTQAQRTADATLALALTPFATIYLGDGDPKAFLDKMWLARVVNLGLFRQQPRSLADGSSPYIWSFTPDRTTTTELSAGFLCRKIYGNKAGGAGDPAMRLRTRRIALVQPADPTSALSQLGTQLRAAVDARCGQTLEVHLYAPIGALQIAEVTLVLKLRGVTTVICYCDGDALSQARITSTALAYAPEWYADDATGTLDAGGTAHATFGVTSQWRGGAEEAQIPSKMYLHEDSSGGWDTTWNATVYYTMLSLFSGIQSSGPNLRAETFERGLFTFNYLHRDNPFVPVGGYGSYGPKATGRYSWIDTGMAWWWDPTGTYPDGPAAGGCRRVAEEGKRHFADDWVSGDSDLFVVGAPCTAPVLA